MPGKFEFKIQIDQYTLFDFDTNIIVIIKKNLASFLSIKY